VVKHYEKRLCAEDATFCDDKIWDEVSQDSFYIADIDNLQLVIHHSMQAPLFFEESGHTSDFADSNYNLFGVLLPPYGSKIKTKMEFPFGDWDKLRVSDFIKGLPSVDSSSTLFLDSAADAPDHLGKSFRESGLIAHIDIGYNNIRCDGSLNCAFGAVPITYRYRCSRVSEAHHSDTELIQTNSTHRIRIERYGILLKFIQTGRLGRFSFMQLLINIVGGLGCLTIVVTILDLFAVYIGRNARFYFQKKYKEVDQAAIREEKKEN